jgi:putative peptide zinc metalloprotease protein
MYTNEMKVAVFPFTRQVEGEEVVIGRVDTGVFLSLPPDAIEILDLLAAGETVGGAQEIYRQRHGETPDMEDFLGFLQSKGFVRPWKDLPPPPGATGAGPGAMAGPPQQRRYHFTNIPQSVAQALFGPVALLVMAFLIALATIAVAQAPVIFPGRSSLFFRHDKTLMMLGLVLIGYATVFIHEMGHLVAARARGVSSRIGINRRLWVLVAETDMTGLWSVPRQQRYLPMLAGPLVDLSSAAIMLLCLFAAYRHWIALPIPALELLSAMCFMYMMRLLWQCFLFVRTDFYYVIANFFGCKSLMQDTQVYIQNQILRLLAPARRRVDQSHLPEKERRVIHAYSWVWLLGRMLALVSLLFITIPVMLKYLTSCSKGLLAGFSAGPYAFFDALFTFTFIVVPIVIGLVWWLASMVKRWRLDSERRAYAT